MLPSNRAGGHLPEKDSSQGAFESGSGYVTLTGLGLGLTVSASQVAYCFFLTNGGVGMKGPYYKLPL